MMDFGGMVRDLVWGLSFTVMVMYITEHGGMTLFMERAGTIFTVVTAGLQIFGKGRLMARVDFTARTGVSSLAISKMDGAMGRAYW